MPGTGRRTGSGDLFGMAADTVSATRGAVMQLQPLQGSANRVPERLTLAGLSALSLLFIPMLLSVEGSLQTSIVFNRGSAWTVWLYKLGPLSLADYGIAILAAATILLFRRSLFAQPYFGLSSWGMAYLLLGLIYNIIVFSFWKTWLYDFKCVLFLTVPFFYLAALARHGHRVRWLTPEMIIGLTVLAGFLDWIIVRFFGQFEYPDRLGIGVYPTILGPVVSAVGFWFARYTPYRCFFLLIFLVDVFIAYNRFSFGVLQTAAEIIPLIVLLRARISLPLRIVAITLFFLSLYSMQTWLIYDPPEFLSAKADGVTTRRIQMDNALQNYSENIPGFVGKGLGVTWFEHVPIPRQDVYSVGTSVGETSAEAMDSPVKFVFNWKPPAILHKWGLAGTLVLCALLAIWYHRGNQEVRRLAKAGLSHTKVRRIEGLLVLSTIWASENFMYVGCVKASLLTSLIGYVAWQELQDGGMQVGRSCNSVT